MMLDPWLEAWLPWVRTVAGPAPVLEIGCGAGDDSVVLAAQGLQLVALDLDADNVAAARQRVPAAEFHCRDLRLPFPLADGTAGLVVASLSLHYFDHAQTDQLFRRVHQVLRPGGGFLCRLNSSRDHHFGASGHPLIEPGYFLVAGQPKRFFDEAAVRRVFNAGWRVQALAEKSTAKYGHTKWLWEVVAERSD